MASSPATWHLFKLPELVAEGPAFSPGPHHNQLSLLPLPEDRHPSMETTSCQECPFSTCCPQKTCSPKSKAQWVQSVL